MDLPARIGLAVLVAGAPVALTACTSQSIGTLFPSTRRAPPDAIVLAPSERITLTALEAKQKEYLCSNGVALRCDRLSFKLYCECPTAGGL